MAGRVLIAATGELDDSLSANPSFSFFTKRYSKHANFATENFKLTFPEKIYTNDFLEVPIPQKYGDILRGVVLSFVADPTNVATLGSNLYPVDVFGISVIDYVELFVGGHKIDTITGDDIFIDRELNVSESYRSSVNTLHGNPFQGSGEPEFVQEFLDGQYNTRGINPFNTDEYRIHIPFYFHRRPGNGFPLCAIYDQELTLRIKLRPAIDVLFATQNKIGDATLWDPEANNRVLEQLELSRFTVNLDLVHLDIAERCMLQNTPLRILFEQHQRNTFLIEPRSTTGTFRLDFTNCVKELFFIAKKFGHWTQDQIDILNRIHALDSLSSSQLNTINELRQSLYSISIWEEIIRIAISRLTGVTDLGVRKNVVDVLRQTVVWGPTQLTLLTGVEENTTDIAAATTALIQYLYTIPNLIVNTQTTVDTELGRLPSVTDEFERENIITTLIGLQNVWGADQITILNSLINPNVQDESLLIFQLRTFVAQLSYFLIGLSTLIPGSPEQLNVVNGLEGYLNDLTVQSDILKLGMIAVLNTLPGKTDVQRGTIVDGLIRIGAEATIWGSPQLDLLESLRNAFNDANIPTLVSYLNGLSGDIDQTVRIDGIITLLGEFPGLLEAERLERVTALRQFSVWRDDPIKLVNSLPSLTPGSEGRAAVINSLIEYSNVLIDEVPTLQFTLNNLKNGVNGILDTIATLTTTAERDPLIIELVALDVWSSDQLTTLNALRIPSVNDATYITQLKATSTQVPITQSIQNDIIQKLFSRNYWGNQILTLENLRLVVPGFIGQTVLVNALNTYIAGLPTSLNLVTSLNAVVAETTKVARDPLIDSLITLGIWSAAQIVTLNALREPDFNDISTLVPEANTRIDILKDGFKAELIGIPALTAIEREPIIDSLIALGTDIWGSTELTTLGLLRTPSGNDVSYVASLRAFIDAVNTPEAIMLNSGVEITVRGFNFSNTYLTSNVITPLDTDPLPLILENRNEFVSNLVAETGLWGSSQLSLLEELRSDTPTGYIDRLSEYVKGVLSTLAVGYVDKTTGELNTINTTLSTNPLPTITENRNEFVSNLESITGVWGSEQEVILDDLRSSITPTTLTEQLTEYINGTLYHVLTPTGKTDVELQAIITTLETDPTPSILINRNDYVSNLEAETGVWGSEQSTLLTSLRSSITPTTLTEQLTEYINGILYQLLTPTTKIESELNTIITTLETDPIPSIVINRNDYVSNLEAETGVWGSEQSTLLTSLRTSTTPTTLTEQLTEYINGILYQLLTPTTKIESELNTIITTLETDPLPDVGPDRTTFIDGLVAETNVWGASQLTLLNDLRTTTPDNHINRLIQYVKGILYELLTGTTKTESELNAINATLAEDPIPAIVVNRNEFISNLVAETNVWGADQLALLDDLRTTTPDNHINRLIQYVKGILYELLTGTTKTESELNAIVTTLAETPIPAIVVNRNEFISNLEAITGVWGVSQESLLNDLRTTTPANHIDRLTQYVKGVLYAVVTPTTKTESELNDINTLLGGTIPSIFINRNDFVSNLEAETGLWEAGQLTLLNDLRTTTPTGHIDRLIEYVNGVLSTLAAGYVDRTTVALQGIITLLGGAIPSIFINRNDFVSNLEAIQNLWGADQLTLLNNLRTSDTSPSLITYVTAIRDTIIALDSDSPDTTNRGVLVDTLLGFLMWGATQRTLIDVEFRVVGSQAHTPIIDGLVTYLGNLKTLATTYYNPTTGLGLLTTLLNTNNGALHTTIVGLLQQSADTVWDGYFFRLLEELKDPAIAVDTEATHISELQEYVNITFFTAALSRDLVFLLTQPTVKYPPTVFNKWARGKKHVPLMYSKQNKTTLECDGETIINETSGNNLFLSTSLSNIYHKRSPVFRNINMYSFALHPDDLEPSGHMNFSTVKDAQLTMNLEYDGSQGTFDFNDNYIEVLGIPQIDFPKQVIIIAKSYNMMIIGDGKAKILFR
jgi:hypothetical protein